ncbi:MAG: ComEC/Rec2 family competence protein [Prevotella sp.]|nr:ComEC/Rec2 family competence protein [Prevotella sp.]
MKTAFGIPAKQPAPMLRLSLFLAFGAGWGSCMTIPYALLFSFFAVLSITFIYLYFFRRLHYAQTFILYSAIVLFGAILSRISLNKMLGNVPTEQQVYASVVNSSPVERGKVVQFSAYVVDGVMKGRKINMSVLKDNSSQAQQLKIGDCIIAKSKFKSLRETDSSYYNRYLYIHGFSATSFIYCKNWKKTGCGISLLPLIERMKLRAMSIRDNIINRLKPLNMADESFSIVAAMTLGDKTYLKKQTYETYSHAGVAHILALSGMHIGIIFMFLYSVLRSRKFDYIREAIVLFTVWAYILIVGMPLSAVRAGTMMTIFLIVSMLNTDKSSLNSLGTAAIVMLLVNPLTILDISFQLSFVAVFFLLIIGIPISYIHPTVKSRILQLPISWIWTLCAMSIAAQIGTLPLTLYHFGTTTPYFLFGNIIAVPSAYIIILLFGLIAPLSFCPSLQSLLSVFLSSYIECLNSLLSAISSLPYSDTFNIKISIPTTILLYICILLLSYCFLKYYNRYCFNKKLKKMLTTEDENYGYI